MTASPRFTLEQGHLVLIELPEEARATLLATILAHDPLVYGDYAEVAFHSACGIQQFRPLGTGRNAATGSAVTVPCHDLRFFTALAGSALTALIEALYHAHPYEEPVIYLTPTTRTRHIRGMGEDSPHRFWNRETPDWVPEEHR